MNFWTLIIPLTTATISFRQWPWTGISSNQETASGSQCIRSFTLTILVLQKSSVWRTGPLPTGRVHPWSSSVAGSLRLCVMAMSQGSGQTVRQDRRQHMFTSPGPGDACSLLRGEDGECGTRGICQQCIHAGDQDWCPLVSALCAAAVLASNLPLTQPPTPQHGHLDYRVSDLTENRALRSPWHGIKCPSRIFQHVKHGGAVYMRETV